jgi:hypothetical protein
MSCILESCNIAEQSVIVWDLETIPDLAAVARMLDMHSAPDREVSAGASKNISIRAQSVTAYFCVTF